MIGGNLLDGRAARPALSLPAVCAALALGLSSGSNANPCSAQDFAAAIEFDSGNFLLNVKTPPGLVAAELRSSKSRGGATTLVVSQEMKTEFKDDGRAPDRLAKDGVYTGFVPGDIKSEVARYTQQAELLKKDTPIPIFEGRAFKGVKGSSAFFVERTAGTIPILGVSARSSISIEKSIAVTDLTVIEAPDYTYNPCSTVGNPGGVWTFGHLMKEIADSEGVNPSALCLNWLDHWASDQVINGNTALERIAVKDAILSAWDPNNTGVLSMPEAPFRLLGIFNRVDLRESTYGGGGSAGELRFVYCFHDSCSQNPRPFLVILEYGVQKVGCAVKQWGTQWAELSTMALGSPEYLRALARLTTEVTDLHSNPNGHRLSQLRTDEFIAHPWELREFVVSDNGFLVQKSVVATPDNALNASSWLANVINTGALNQGVPTFSPLEEGSSSINDPNLFWNAGGISNLRRRHKFSLNTCNSCHGRETDTFFTHVKEAPYGVPPQLSDFLTGGGAGVGFQVADPVDGTIRTFNDLERRRQDLQNLVDLPCLRQVLDRARADAILSH